MTGLPEFSELVGHTFDNIDGEGLTHRHWMDRVRSEVEGFTYDQNVPSPTWTIVHNLGYRPSVVTTDTLGREFHGAVEYIDENSLRVQFGSPVLGHAYLS